MSEPTRSTPEDLGTLVVSLRQYAAERAQLGDVAEVHRAGDALVSLDDDELGRAEPGVTRNMLDAAPSLLAAGDLRRAEILLLKGIRALSINPQATQVDLIVPLNNLMAVYDQKGDFAQRNQIAAAIGSIVERLAEPLTPSAAHVLLQLGHMFERAGNLGATLVMLGPVHGYMTSAQDVDADTLLGWCMSYARPLMAVGDHDGVIAVCRQALAVAEGGRQIEILAVLATASARKGDAAMTGEALEWAAGLAEAAEDAGGLTDPRIQTAAGAVYHNLASHYLAQKRPETYERAEALMRRALGVVIRGGGTGSAEHAGALGQLAVIAEFRGDLDAAEALYGQSIAVYEGAGNTNAAEHSDFATDLGLMLLRRGRASDAIPSLARVVELRDATDGESVQRRADAAANLATAYFEAGDLASASRLYTRAIDLRFAAPMPNEMLAR